MKKYKCDSKRKFSSRDAACEAVCEYYRDVVLSIDPVVAYECVPHKCWHIGHDRPEDLRRMRNRFLCAVGYYRAA